MIKEKKDARSEQEEAGEHLTTRKWNHLQIKTIPVCRTLGEISIFFGGYMRENLAELCHSQWCGWMKYLFSKCSKRANGSMIIPKWAVDRWGKQMQTPYSELSDSEMDSDRAEADRFIALFLKEKN